jgi:hypothetical protein
MITLEFDLQREIPSGGIHLPNFRVQADVMGNGRQVAIVPFGALPRLRAIDLVDGAVLWDFEELEPEPHSIACAAADWDRDGAVEIMVAHASRLLLLEGSSGRIKREGHLSCHGVPSFIALAVIPALSARPVAIVLVQGAGVVAVNGDLEELWTVPSYGNGVGHYVFVGDTDGDGQDECLFSIEKRAQLVHVDHEGTIIWSKGILDELRLEPEGLEDHVDQLQIYDINEDGRPEIVIATGGCCLDSRGRLLWHHNDALVHGQCICCGRFESASSPLAVFADAWTPTPQVVASDGSGRLLWTYRDFSHRIFSIARLERDGGYLLVAEQDYQEGDPFYHVHLLDGVGRCLDRFAFRDEGGVQMPFNPQAGVPPPDLLWRGVHCLLCGDVDADGRQEVVIDDLAGVLRVLKVRESASTASPGLNQQ